MGRYIALCVRVCVQGMEGVEEGMRASVGSIRLSLLPLCFPAQKENLSKNEGLLLKAIM